MEVEKAEQRCACLDTPRKLPVARYLGMDAHYGEAALHLCPDCGRYWLHYFYEVEAFSGSGRWYFGILAPEQAETISAEEASSALEALEWYFYGGSYFGKSGRSSGPINLFP